MMSREVGDVVMTGHGYPVGYTYSGHPVCCAVASVNLDVLEREDLLTAASHTGAYLAAQLEPLRELPVVGEIRQAGMGIALELVADQESREPLPEPGPGLADVIRDETGVVVRVSSSHNLVFSPPLVMTESEADRAVEGVASVLRRVRPDGTL